MLNPIATLSQHSTSHEMQKPMPCEGRQFWFGFILVSAGMYNLMWGTAVILFPNTPFEWLGIPQPNYPVIWQGMGMVVGVYGIGYLLAAHDPWRHWPVILVGALGKLLGPIGFLYYAIQGEIPWALGAMCLTNDLLWWGPFGWILWDVWKSQSTNLRWNLPESERGTQGGIDGNRTRGYTI